MLFVLIMHLRENSKSILIYRSFYFITDINPLKLVVTLKGEAKEARSIMAGIYVLGHTPVNDRSHWLQVPGGLNAIWYNKQLKSWSVGSKGDLGSSRAGLVSYGDVAGPQEATTWQYSYKQKWISGSDNVLVETYVEPGTYIYHK